ncbi:hypoxanthine phosphoribosyltransferase [Hydrocarboniphaga daqingensis]|jgi:hypoxanthine phosphoribosyltransferase|uniref:Hypoxanthine phosphoribosyltransferase n=1 Tax=Hydrocarboniphaga daqingensis TaxID=490188 RepID=A0A1M5KI77_9GAMM|nr:hypoxanthine-guanine phosphoribosyltransferase [Hydrocarboniphaga daqingensis]SHG52425.1 hypoxanthine phosphoribosyltransferase [Hydrocarboniphaga daqingensis]
MKPKTPHVDLQAQIAATLAEARAVMAEADCLHDAAAVKAAYDRLGHEITARYADLNPLILTVMNGGLLPTAEIVSRLPFAFEQDYLHATRYRGATTGGGLVWKRQPDAKRISGRHVLVIDDILDEGYTLVAIRKALLEFQPASFAVAVTCEKLHDRRAPGAVAEFVGVKVEDRYVFGCGMDYKEYWRQLPAIYAVKGL